MRLLLLIPLLLLAACGTKLEAGNDRGGIVYYGGAHQTAQAFTLADRHCQQFGRRAVFQSMPEFETRAAFQCVP
jgi:hypothetical protein